MLRGCFSLDYLVDQCFPVWALPYQHYHGNWCPCDVCAAPAVRAGCSRAGAEARNHASEQWGASSSTVYTASKELLSIILF